MGKIKLTTMSTVRNQLGSTAPEINFSYFFLLWLFSVSISDQGQANKFKNKFSK
jgi:hypothetical protein